jgi:tRNA A-37 threonylcarbamoyl transferase component Bud32
MYYSFIYLYLSVFSLFLVSVSGKRGVGIPVVVLHDAEGGIITVELKNGDAYRGMLEEAADNMNFTMKVGKCML